MENTAGPDMAAKSDAELQNTLQEKHTYNPETYIAAIEELERRGQATPELLQEKTQAIELLKQNKQPSSWKATLDLFKITKEYFYTPIIIYLNVLIWLIMVVTGTDAFEPSVDSLITWGGNLSSITLGGQPWRLFTSTFLHGGIFHLLLNMYALLQVGAIIETSFGKHRYALVYIVTGILASITSAAFSENIVSVGASGAIFGLYGLFLSLLITKSLHLTTEERTSFLYSTLTFIGYNVAFGFAKEDIDNAAHIGGLLSGFIIGFLYYAAANYTRGSVLVSIFLVALVAISTWAAPRLITNKYAEFQAAIETFSTNEEKALWMYSDTLPAAGTTEAERFHNRLKTEGIDLWTQNIALLDGLRDMPENLQQRIDVLKKYCLLRKESCEIMQTLTGDNADYAAQTIRLNEINTQIDSLIDSLEALNK